MILNMVFILKMVFSTESYEPTGYFKDLNIFIPKQCKNDQIEMQSYSFLFNFNPEILSNNLPIFSKFIKQYSLEDENAYFYPILKFHCMLNTDHLKNQETFILSMRIITFYSKLYYDEECILERTILYSCSAVLKTEILIRIWNNLNNCNGNAISNAFKQLLAYMEPIYPAIFQKMSLFEILDFLKSEFPAFLKRMIRSKIYEHEDWVFFLEGCSVRNLFLTIFVLFIKDIDSDLPLVFDNHLLESIKYIIEKTKNYVENFNELEDTIHKSIINPKLASYLSTSVENRKEKLPISSILKIHINYYNSSTSDKVSKTSKFLKICSRLSRLNEDSSNADSSNILILFKIFNNFERHLKYSTSPTSLFYNYNFINKVNIIGENFDVEEILFLFSFSELLNLIIVKVERYVKPNEISVVIFLINSTCKIFFPNEIKPVEVQEIIINLYNSDFSVLYFFLYNNIKGPVLQAKTGVNTLLKESFKEILRQKNIKISEEKCKKPLVFYIRLIKDFLENKEEYIKFMNDFSSLITKKSGIGVQNQNLNELLELLRTQNDLSDLTPCVL